MIHGATLRRTGARLGAGVMARRHVSVTPTQRMKSLRQLMASQDLVRMLEVHNGLTALVSHEHDGQAQHSPHVALELDVS